MSDLISRQDAIDAMMRLQEEDVEIYGCRIPEGFDGGRAVRALKNVPSAENTGKWLKYEGRFDYNWECSECGCSAWDKTDYCAYCGAKMEVEDD